MDKEVIPWFQMVQKIEPFLSWLHLTQALETEFGPSPFECPQKALFKLQQTSTVAAYYLEFIALANRSPGLPADVLLAFFLGGLLLDLQREVIAHSPPTLLCAVALAKIFEEKYVPRSTPIFLGSSFRTTSSFTPPKPTVAPRPALPPGPTINPTRTQLPGLLPTPTVHPNLIRKLSSAEM